MNTSSFCLPNADDYFGPQVEPCKRQFDFTLLFEQSILTIGPSALFIILLTPRAIRLYHLKRKTLPNPLWGIKLVTILVYLSFQIAILALWTISNEIRTSVAAAALSVIATVGLASLSSLENNRSTRPSLIICTYLLISGLLDIAQMRTLWLQHERTALAALFTCTIVVKLVLLCFEAVEKRSFLREPYNTYPSEALAGPINRSLFWWLNILIQKGQKSILGLGDLFNTDKALSSAFLEEKMRQSWRKQSSSGKYSLFSAMIACFRYPLLTLIFPRICLIGFKFSQPFLINRAISFVDAPESPENNDIGYALIGATVLIYIGLAISTAQYRHQIYRVITMIRGGLVCLIYDTTLALDANSIGNAAAITLMSTDIDRIGTGFSSIDSLWAGPIEAGIAIYLLQRELGPACIAPVIISLVCTIGAFSIGKWAKHSQKEWMEAVQKRVAITSSTLGSIKGIKMQGLTKQLSADLHELRVQELEYAKPFRRNIIATAVTSNITALCGPAITFIIYILIQRSKSSATLNIAQAFTSLSLISLLSTPVSEIVQTIPAFAAAMGCVERIQTYIRIKEHKDPRFANPDFENTSTPVNSQTRNDARSDEVELVEIGSATTATSVRLRNENIIAIKDASSVFAGEGIPILNDINLEVRRGTLTMIVGPIGSGKSSLLKVMLGELHSTKGFVFACSSSVAFCSQTAWLPNSTIQELVLGVSSYDETWYNTIMSACMLDRDIASFPDGGNTAIGSDGVALSGGQKQRLALARALYSRKNVLIVDDVLSGLDTKISYDVFRNVFGKGGLCRLHNITTILATHAVQYLRSADNVVVLSESGCISGQGTFETLSKKEDSYVKDMISPEEERIEPTDKKKSALVSNKFTLSNPSASDDIARQDGDASVYMYFAKSVGGLYSALFFCAVLLFTLSSEFQAVLLELWSKSETNHPGVYTNMYMGLYAMLSVLSLCGIGGLLCVTLLFAGPHASINLHRMLLHTVIAAPCSWFTSTDSGVTLNRFSQDMSLIDMELLVGIVDTFAGTFMAIAQATLIAIGAIYVGIILPFIICILYILQKVYLKTSRQLRLLDLESKSPLYTHFTETLNGLVSIRAFGWETHYAQKNRDHLDMSQKPYYLLFCIQRWLNLVLDLILAGIAVILIAFATQMKGTSSAGTLGIALVNILQFNGTLSFLIRKWTQLETSIGAVARVKSLERDVEPEDREGDLLPEGWPNKGRVEFRDVSASYGTGELALRNISFTIEAGQKIGIIGRTGSGKSSLLLTIFHMLSQTTGTVLIDNIPLSTLNLQALRSSLISIPQDPFFLSGSVRYNLDPFRSELVSDESFQDALTKVGLLEMVLENGGLDAEIWDGRMSAGQKQLCCLARALVRKVALGNREQGVLVLDEVTSSVDEGTEGIMMRVLGEAFQGWTVLNVAHRLGSLKGYDGILVMDGGRVMDVGTLDEMLGREGEVLGE